MILIYSSTSSKRLQYICQFIFREQLGITYSITIDSEGFKNHDGPKINYSRDPICDDELCIKNESLLFEEDIKLQPIDCFTLNGKIAFFKSASGYPFDIFAASFYLLSRYEEYLPHSEDMYGRYDHTNSLASKKGFLGIPLVNIWILDFANELTKKIPSLEFNFPSFTYLPTYDIDIAFSYKHKGLLRNIGGFIKSPSIDRVKVLMRLEEDPYDCYTFLDHLHAEADLKPIYFFLAATSPGKYDKNISPYSHPMWQLIKAHAKKYRTGLHPSWKSNENVSIIKKEKKIIESAGNISVIDSRQHYIRFSLPGTFTNLMEAGIRNDFSMGYGSINGFRASVASPFFWFNLHTNQQTELRIHPFCFMDANSYYEQGFSPEQALVELTGYYNVCKTVNGTCISIFHNHFLGNDKKFAGWKEMYSSFISRIRQ
ncbi:MAG TPA: hypothetical protein VK498_13060 [Ferruginibacter sp.]|nr:hypothetical protein [Ferruginibacter sp.]